MTQDPAILANARDSHCDASVTKGMKLVNELTFGTIHDFERLQNILELVAREKAVECERALLALASAKDEQFKNFLIKHKCKEHSDQAMQYNDVVNFLLQDLEAGR